MKAALLVAALGAVRGDDVTVLTDENFESSTQAGAPPQPEVHHSRPLFGSVSAARRACAHSHSNPVPARAATGQTTGKWFVKFYAP
eukprot:COSAG04_NODE_6526_length_1309_cov_30.300826_4_plen_85_part_01